VSPVPSRRGKICTPAVTGTHDKQAALRVRGRACRVTCSGAKLPGSVSARPKTATFGTVIAMNLNHIDLPVSDIAGARDFFERHFAFRCILARADGLTVLLDDGGFALTLSALPPGERLSYPTGFHVGFNVREEQELLSAHERLVAAGVEMARPLGKMGGALTFQCKAPGPVIVELGWRPPR
jgi:catechol 2,3-dioxygenase-like lactoylglutathione lyase family enzyme